MKFLRLTIPLILAAILASCSSQSVKNKAGENAGKAYNFTLPDQNGRMTSLSEILQNQKGAVIAFYPKDDSRN